MKCPAGIDESTAMVVGPAGGKLTLAGRQGNGVPSSLTIPPKAFDRDVTITLVETSIPPPKEFVDWSPIWEVLPSCLTSFSRMTLRLPYSNRDGLVGPITIYHAKDRNSPFVPLPEVYGNAGFGDGAITEGGLFFVGYPKSPGQANCP